MATRAVRGASVAVVAVGLAVATTTAPATGLAATAARLRLARLGVLDRLRVDDHTAAPAVFARRGEVLKQPAADPLAGHLHQAERGDLGDLVARAVAGQALGEPPQHEIAVGLQHHVDEVDHDDAADVAQPQLAHDLLGRFEVVAGDRLLEVAAGAGELAGVDVDDRHRLGAVDHQRAARRQPHLAVERLEQLLVDPVGAEDVLVADVAVHAVGELGRDVRQGSRAACPRRRRPGRPAGRSPR